MVCRQHVFKPATRDDTVRSTERFDRRFLPPTAAYRPAIVILMGARCPNRYAHMVTAVLDALGMRDAHPLNLPGAARVPPANWPTVALGAIAACSFSVLECWWVEYQMPPRRACYSGFMKARSRLRGGAWTETRQMLDFIAATLRQWVSLGHRRPRAKARQGFGARDAAA